MADDASAGATGQAEGQQGDQGGQAAPPDWRAAIEGLPDELKADKTLGRYKTLPEALKAIPELHRTVSGGLTKIPGADAKPEEVAAFREKLGVPKDVSGYADVRVPDVEGIAADEKAVSGFIAAAHKAGFTPQQAQDALNYWAQWQGAQRTALIDGFVNDQEKLREEWGLNFDRNVVIADRGLQYAVQQAKVGEGFVKILNDTGLTKHPDMIRLGRWIGEQLAEASIIDPTVAGATTTETAKAKISAIQGDPKHPANDPAHPRHAEGLAELRKLYQIIHGTEPLFSVG